MEITSDLCVCLMRFIIVCYVGFICLVCSEGRCRNENGRFENQERCVRNLTCLQFERKIDITWIPPQDGQTTIDFVITLNDLSINGKSQLIVLNNTNSVSVNASSTRPGIEINTFYNVTVKRRHAKDDAGRHYRVERECRKVQISTPGVGNIPDQKVTQGNTDTETNESENSGFVGGYASIIIGLCVAVLAVSIIIVILAFRYVKKKRMGNIKGKDPNEKPHDNLGGLKDDTNEEDTYNRLTLRYQENKVKQERISQDTYAHITETETQGKGGNLPQAAHAPITHHYDGNYDDIPFEFEKTGKTETASTNEPLMQDKPKVEDSKPDDVKGALTGDVYATVDKGNTQQIEDGLNRAEGPQGDLYTEVTIKR